VFCARFGWGQLFETPEYIFNQPVELIFYVVLGLLCALTGILYINVFYGMRDKFFHKIPIPPHFKPAIGGLLLGLLGLFVPQILAGGYGFVQQAIYGELAVHYMLLFAFAKMVSTSFTVSSGGSGGVFAPSLFIGGMLGGAFGQIAESLFPGAIADPTAFVLVGMGAFFAGAAKTPISSMIMVCEMTGGYHLLVPMMAASAMSYLLTGRTSIYEKQVDTMADSPAHLGDFTMNVLEEMTVEQAYVKSPSVTVIPEDARYSSFRRAVSRSDKAYFPVVDKNKRIVGIISLRNVHSILFEEELDETIIAKDLMTPPVFTTPPENLHSALLKFISSDYGILPVVDEKDETKIIGLLAHEDLIVAYNKELVKRKPNK
jgi:CIC family chloride channel protein